MADPLQELDALLQSLQSLKPPGVAGSKVSLITKLCTTANVSLRELTARTSRYLTHTQIDREQIVDVIINAFKRSPTTHKLGVMYCADSVVRQWIAQGRANNAGVQKFTINVPSLMEELITTAPDAQKVCSFTPVAYGNSMTLSRNAFDHPTMEHA
jgi:protein NRD1